MNPSPRSTLLLASHVDEAFREQLAARFDLLGPFAAPFPEAVLALAPEDVARVRAIYTIGVVPITRVVIDALPSLRIIACLGSGYEGIDRVAARERGVVVTHNPGANASAVADLALTLMLASVRRLRAYDRILRRGEWRGNAQARVAVPRGITGRRLGIFGLGAIGAKVAERALACEMEIGYHNRRRRSDVPYAYFDTLHDLAAWADVLMITVRADAGTRHAVNADVLAALGPEGHVVNVARGSVIDEVALVAALEAGRIAGAGLDVFEHEPQVPQALLDHPNAVLTPHLGGGTRESYAAMQAMTLANLDAFLAGRAVPNPIPA